MSGNPCRASSAEPGEMLALAMDPAEGLVLAVEPAPKALESPLLLGATGAVHLADDTLALTGVRGEPGTESELIVVLASLTNL